MARNERVSGGFGPGICGDGEVLAPGTAVRGTQPEENRKTRVFGFSTKQVIQREHRGQLLHPGCCCQLT